MSPKPKEVANWKLKTRQPKWQWAHLAGLVTGEQVTSVSVKPQIVKDPHWRRTKMARLLPAGRMPGLGLPPALDPASESSWRRPVWPPLIQIRALHHPSDNFKCTSLEFRAMTKSQVLSFIAYRKIKMSKRPK